MKLLNRSEKGLGKPKVFQEKLIIALTLMLFLAIACTQQPVQPTEPTTPEESEPIQEEPEEIQVIPEEPEPTPPAEPEVIPEEEPKETCALGYTCLDDKRLGYRTSKCTFSNVKECPNGCKDGACIIEAPPKEEIKEEYSLTQGKGTMEKIGRRYLDFSKNELFIEGINDFDLRLKLYSDSSNNDYFRAESSGPYLWLIDKGITEAKRSDCDKVYDENSYHSLGSGQTLCIKTKERDIALIGGTWEGLPDEYTELTWKYYIPKE